jgi:hypothetical protein
MGVTQLADGRGIDDGEILPDKALECLFLALSPGGHKLPVVHLLGPMAGEGGKPTGNLATRSQSGDGL